MANSHFGPWYRKTDGARSPSCPAHWWLDVPLGLSSAHSGKSPLQRNLRTLPADTCIDSFLKAWPGRRQISFPRISATFSRSPPRRTDRLLKWKVNSNWRRYLLSAGTIFVIRAYQHSPWPNDSGFLYEPCICGSKGLDTVSVSGSSKRGWTHVRPFWKIPISAAIFLT